MASRVKNEENTRFHAEKELAENKTYIGRCYNEVGHRIQTTAGFNYKPGVIRPNSFIFIHFISQNTSYIKTMKNKHTKSVP